MQRLTNFSYHAVLFQGEIFFKHTIYLKSRFLIKLHIILIVCLQRDHHPVLICVAYGFLQKSCRNPMMLHLRINCQIDHVEPAILMKLISPVRVQIVSALDKIVKCVVSVEFSSEQIYTFF